MPRFWLVLAIAMFGLLGVGASLALTAATSTTGTVTACVTVTSPTHTIFDNTRTLGTIPRQTRAGCSTATYTIPDATTVTVTSPATTEPTTTATTTTEPTTTTTPTTSTTPPPSGQEVTLVDIGWAPSSNIPWNDLTQIDLFNLATSAGPALDKSNIQNINVPAWVAAAHSHGLKAKIQIGGAGNDNWGTACNDTNRAQFVQNLVSFAKTNGFDAVDLDIEDGPWSRVGPPNPAMTTCIIAIANATHAAGMFTSEDVITPWQTPWVTPSAAYIDQFQLMTFYGSFSQVQSDMQQAVADGLPRSKLLVGIDVDDFPDPPFPCGQAMTYSKDQGFKGVFVWEAFADSQHGNVCTNAVAAAR